MRHNIRYVSILFNAMNTVIYRELVRYLTGTSYREITPNLCRLDKFINVYSLQMHLIIYYLETLFPEEWDTRSGSL